MPAPNAFAELIGLRIERQSAGESTLTLDICDSHLNPHAVVHGAVLYALVDTGMGAALYPTLAEGELCATIEIKISDFKPVRSGRLVRASRRYARPTSASCRAARAPRGCR